MYQFCTRWTDMSTEKWKQLSNMDRPSKENFECRDSPENAGTFFRIRAKRFITTSFKHKETVKLRMQSGTRRSQSLEFHLFISAWLYENCSAWKSFSGKVQTITVIYLSQKGKHVTWYEVTLSAKEHMFGSSLFWVWVLLFWVWAFRVQLFEPEDLLSLFIVWTQHFDV